jgi:4-nitrophenyl phosphatase/phosphoglycolate phosphatase
MKFTATPAILATLLANASAFGVRQPAKFSALRSGAFGMRQPAKRAFTHATQPLSANVLKLSDPQKEILDEVDVFIFDCDGVIWRGDSLIDGIPETLEKLRKAGKRMFFVTNNSTKSRA